MISVIIPFYNEKENLTPLLTQLINKLDKTKKEYEIVFVDDGSTDGFGEKFKVQSSKFKLVSHRKRAGKGQALKTGIENSKGDVIIFMDADLQDDPEDIPVFLKKINEGYDFINGIRTKRNDSSVVKFYSRLAGFFLRGFLNSPFRDINCGFKAFKREVLKDFVFYGNNFRFFPLAVFYNGYRVTDIKVKNNPRLHGKSKFGPGKLMTGVFDTLTAYFLYRFAEKPLHFFGSIGVMLFFAGFLVSFYLTIEKLFFGVKLSDRPLLWLGILLLIIGIQVTTTGIIGELIVYLHRKSKNS